MSYPSNSDDAVAADKLRGIVGNIMGLGHYKAFEMIAHDVPELTPKWMKQD